MPKYWRDPDSGTVFQYRGDPDGSEVIVIPADKWREMVACVSRCGGRGDRNVEDIWTIIAETEAQNG